MEQLTVALGERAYPIYIGCGLMDAAGAQLAPVLGTCAVAVVTDDNVAPLYLGRAEKSLEAAGFRCVSIVLPHGEKTKCMDSLSRLYAFFAEHHITRRDAVLALGGGVIGDLAGFAAATYLRGIAVAQVPTTLLAAVDSSVGGKTAIDLAAGKNLAGAFHKPIRVICDPNTFATLPPEQLAAGMAEAIKYGILFDAELFGTLSHGAPADMAAAVARCVALKQDVVSRDFTDRGERQLLNLGHTFGHAIEACSRYAVLHGEAVAIGTVMAARAALHLGVARTDFIAPITAALTAAGLPTQTDYSPAALTAAALHDKKRKGGTVSLVLPAEIGRCVLHPFPVDELGKLMEEVCR